MALVKSPRVVPSGSGVGLQRKPRQPIEGQLCLYTHRSCGLERLDGYDYCIKHILKDKNAPFKQCNYVSNKSGKRCLNAAPKTDRKDGFCTEHSRRALVARQRAHRKRKPRETPETLLNGVEHYASRTLTGPGGNGMDTRRIRAADSLTNRILDYASSSESDTEQGLVDQAWAGDGDSEAESVDSEQEDPLKHAGIYTAEEVALITRDKMIRLQSLYIDQFKRLQHLMKEKRRKYLHQLRQEREVLGSIHSAKDDVDEREDYDRLMATKCYHQRNGKEALVHRQAKERRIAVSEGPNYKPPAHPKCIYQLEGGVRCASRTVPLSKYCLEHVLHDPHQLLYRPCGFNDLCLTPVPHVFHMSRCPAHSEYPDMRQRYPHPDQDVETEDDETKDAQTVDVVGNTDVKPTITLQPITMTTVANDNIKPDPDSLPSLVSTVTAQDASRDEDKEDVMM